MVKAQAEEHKKLAFCFSQGTCGLGNWVATMTEVPWCGLQLNTRQAETLETSEER